MRADVSSHAIQLACVGCRSEATEVGGGAPMAKGDPWLALKAPYSLNTEPR